MIARAVLALAAAALLASPALAGKEERRKAKAACLAEVARTVGVEEVSILSVERVHGGFKVLVEVPEAEAPWGCDADRHGEVKQVYYTSEG